MSAALQTRPGRMTDAEWETRCALAALYHMVDHFGWSDLIYTHMTARVPGEPDAFLINRYGDMFNEVTASSLIKLDFDGNPLGEPGPFNNAGYTIHSSVYRARPDANCVMHTHTAASEAVSLIRDGLRPISQIALTVYDDVVYHDYGVPETAEEGEALGEACKRGTCIMLHNHGTLTFAPTIHSALVRQYLLQHACQLEMNARMMNAVVVPLEPMVIAKAATRRIKSQRGPDHGLPEWNALLRVIERKGFDYRQ